MELLSSFRKLSFDAILKQVIHHRFITLITIDHAT